MSIVCSCGQKRCIYQAADGPAGEARIVAIFRAS